MNKQQEQTKELNQLFKELNLDLDTEIDCEKKPEPKKYLDEVRRNFEMRFRFMIWLNKKIKGDKK